MLHWYSKVTIIFKKEKNVKETVIVIRVKYSTLIKKQSIIY